MHRLLSCLLIALFAPMAALAAPNDLRNGVPTDTGTSTSVTKMLEKKQTDAGDAPARNIAKPAHPHKHSNAYGDTAPTPAEPAAGQ